MKIRVKPKAFPTPAPVSVKSAMLAHSAKKRAEQLEPLSGKGGTTTAKLRVHTNISGNQRGMHNAISPPDSAQMAKVRSMRKLWNKQLPVLQCSNCAFSAQCPQFKSGYECAFLPFLNSHKVETIDDLIFYSKEMLAANLKRSQLAMIMETMAGGAPSLELSEQNGMLFMQLMQLHERMTAPNATLEVTTEDGTIIGGLMGGLKGLMESTREAQRERLEIPFAERSLDEDKSSTLKNNVNPELLAEYSNAKVSGQQEPTNAEPIEIGAVV